MLLIFVIFSSCKNSKIAVDTKEFEGIVIYEVIATPNLPSLSKETIQNHYGNKMTYYYKEGKSKMEYSGKNAPTIFYLGSENKQFTFFEKADTLLETECSIESSKLISSKILPREEKILNINCKILENKTEDGHTYTYCFDESRYINPKHFEKHTFLNVNVAHQKTKGLFLKCHFSGVAFDLTQKAIKIIPTSLKDEEFELPPLPRKLFQ